MQEAIHCWSSGDLVAADAACRSILAIDAGDVDGLLLLADIDFARNRRAAAIGGWRRVLEIRPDDAATHRRLGGALLAVGQSTEAAAVLRRALELEPSNLRALNNLGQALTVSGDPAAAVEPLSRALQLEPRYALAHHNLGLARRELGEPAAALAHFEQALALRGNQPEIRILRGQTLLDMSRPEDALEDFSAALALAPGDSAALRGRAEALAEIGQPEEALQILDRLVTADPRDSMARTARARAHLRCRQFEAAQADADLAMAANPDSAAAHVNRGLARLARGDAAGALRDLDTACRLRPVHGAAHAGRGYALAELGLAEAAIEAHGRAVALGWCDPESLLSAGALLLQLNRLENAHAAFAEAARLQPGNWRAREGVAMTLIGLRRFNDAIPVLESLIGMAPWIKNLPGHLFHARLQCCDWRGYHETAASLARRVRDGESVDTPWSFLTHNADPADQLLCARTYARDHCAIAAPLRRRTRDSARVRVAYLSADFHDHATAHLAAALFEHHDRSRFEITAVSYGPRDGSPMRTRLERAFDRFLDVADRSDEAIAALLDASGIDIAIDMKGFTTGGRPRILAFRPAPVQVAFLAFPGTLGCDFIDYVIADRHVIPPPDLEHYSERVIWMPDSYQVNDAARATVAGAAGPRPRRADAGLDEHAFVFCCFNASFKISPDIFDVWMRILGAVDGSVLWLLEGPKAAVRNLRAEAARCHIDPARLVFAPPLPAAAHWARVGLADLFLDTLPCNAHTTASDALWAGVPLLTMTGSTFAGRVATSLLAVLSMSDMCVASIAEYERLATRLALAPGELAALRARVEQGRRTTPLFDTEAYCRHLERAFIEIHDRQRMGRSPAAIDVAQLLRNHVADAL